MMDLCNLSNGLYWKEMSVEDRNFRMTKYESKKLDRNEI